MRRPVCVKCQRQFRNIKSGVFVIEMFCIPPKPYKIWMADLFECPTCKARIVAGFGDNPVARHYEEDFEHWVREASEGFQVRDYEYPALAPQEGE